MEHNQPLAYCPGCAAPLGRAAEHAGAQGPANCPYCALPLTGEKHAELRRIDMELAGLEQRRAALHGRRQALIAGLRASAQGAARGVSGRGRTWGAASGPVPAHGPVPGSWAAVRAETSSYTARNVLLVLGGVLLTVAAIAFTLLNWGSMGVGGRAAVLGGLTLGTFAVPLLLLRRGLVATAESVAGFGLALMALDAYALHEVCFPRADGLGYTAAGAALIAVLQAGYGLALPGPGLRLPVPFAVVVAQLPLPLWALSLDGASERTAYGVAVALLLTFAADVGLAVSRERDGKGLRVTARAVRLTAAVAAVPAGALTMGVTLSQQPGGVAAAARWGAVQAVAGAVLLLAGQRHQARRVATPLVTVAGLVLTAALGGFVWAVAGAGGEAGPDWRVPTYQLCAMGLLGAVLMLRPVGEARAARLRRPDGLVVAAVVVQCGALVWALVPVVQAVSGPLFFAARAWEGPPGGPVRQAVGTHHEWTGSAATLIVLLVLAVSVALLAGGLDGSARGGQRPGGDGVLGRLTVRSPLPLLPPLCAAAGATAPLALGLSYGPAVTAVAAAAIVLLASSVAVADAATGVTALISGLALTVTASGWALAQQAATLTVLALLCVASAASAAWSPRGGPGRRAALAASAVAYAAALAGAMAAALDRPAHQASFAVLAVAVATVPGAALLRGRAIGPAATAPASRKAISLAVELTGYAAALAALALCVPYPGTLWPALAVCSVSAAGVALRADRRRGAGHGSAALLVLATWVRLFASGVSVPEAYTLPVSAALLIVGLLRRRRTGGDDEAAARNRVSSWWAYGGGLAFTFLPSLVMVWHDPHWLRPLLLGAGALGTALAGARWRTQAPLLLGAATVVSVGAHELAPYVAQVAWLLPRWVMPALAGLLLVVAGATYERRLGDARRLKCAWQRLS
ncbi:hypothetical protein HCC61_24315 [Streptomyces sp. HNM0575]|uniref:SCO7613 C-terminal domain-containing membrane protein n=1 Tax=Streptomyces sp. HNM0575 TaxID=2716338 RepID=UPI00145F3284|nr:hypothetical protein [Streptomyces sp. HNM0575]NLU75738.1 hypothetical protein [Streptomyces sp. HNM0575]